jgi:hypothetical protein
MAVALLFAGFPFAVFTLAGFTRRGVNEPRLVTNHSRRRTVPGKTSQAASCGSGLHGVQAKF